MDAIYHIPLFDDTTDDELQWLIDHSSDVQLNTGDVFTHEGDPNPRFYVVLEGELQITRTIGGQVTVMGTTPRGIIGGEVALLTVTPGIVNALAIMPSRLMVFERAAFRGIFANCPTVGTKILKIAAERMQGFATVVKQQEKMAALGKLSAGLAHELNNPAAAARRATSSLQESLPKLEAQTLHLAALGLSAAQLDQLATFQKALVANAANAPSLSPMQQSDREEELGGWFEDENIANGWEMAGTFVSAGVSLAELQGLVGQLARPQRGPVIAWLHETISAVCLLEEIEESTRRISDLVGAVKSYTFMDQGGMQEVDLHKGLDSTVAVLGYKLKGVKVERHYDPALPKVLARGGELNQVWTNLIDNAIDAMDKKGTLKLITRCENQFAMVEITDSGKGIPADVLPHIFEPFFTTKDVGSGTGLGLDISYRLIKQHSGTIEVQSKPGETRFIVRLPIGA
jgi:signal transduction histidine kinase